jgi:uncharacterized membrane protein (UPF0136 family)
VLFIGSLIGVIKMWKGNNSGLHVYAISQSLMLINASVFVYPLQKPSPFIYDLLLTVMFIVVYFLYFKRMEMSQHTQNQE